MNPWRKLLPFGLLLLVFLAPGSTPPTVGSFHQGPQPVPNQPQFAVRVIFASDGAAREKWTGSIGAENTHVAEAQGWRFDARDRLSLNNFEIHTLHPRTKKSIEKGLVLRGRAGPDGQISITTSWGDFAFRVHELGIGETREFLGGGARLIRLLDVTKITDGSRDDDYPSIAVVDDSRAWLVWQSYGGQSDEIRLSKHENGWRTFTPVPGVSGDVWRPQVALDGQQRLWVVWAQQVNGNFDIYARALDQKSATWQEQMRLSSHPNPDIQHHLASDSRGNLWVVWQGFHGDDSDIFLRRHDGAGWSEEIRVTDDDANDWEPRIAVDQEGRAIIVWDTYRRGNFDVYMRAFQDGRFGPEIPVADTPKFEAHATVAIDNAGRIWVAWDEGGVNWGKDTGLTEDPKWAENPQQSFDNWILKPGFPGSRLYDERELNLAVFENGRRKVPVQGLREALAQAGIQQHDYPQLVSDRRWGRMGLMFHRWSPQGEFTSGLESRRTVFWEQAVTFYHGDRWSAALTIPQSAGRPSMLSSGAFAPDGRLWMAWPTDGRVPQSPYQPVSGDIYMACVPGGVSSDTPVLKSSETAPAAAVSTVHTNEASEIAGIRAYRTSIGGTENRIVRGDFHRHTEFSWDNGGLRDGSLFDFYRYMLDAADMDFGAVTDHNSGGDYGYWWWLIEKSCDMFHVPKAFTTFYGYERSVQYPGGHRNVLHTRRGVPVVSFFTEPGFTGPRPGVAANPNRLVKNDTRLLYDSLRRSGGISIPHTTGSFAGTDWRENDPEVEPLVELYQGARVSYETPGAPRAPRSPDDIRDFREPGFVWNAYRKGYRLGTIASSDHWSTHISYAMVFTEQPTRDAIFDAFRKRRTYGATDNIILEYRMGEHFMGEEFADSSVPPISIRIIGTAPVSRVDVIKNEAVVYSTHPNAKDVMFTYRDENPTTGTSYYYVRVIQTNWEMAWGSPIWLTLKP
jgi:hypothetical protein